MGMGGMGMGGMGMGGMGMGGMGMGETGIPLVSKLNNYLFGFQSLVFSLGQAVQILGMNTQALHQIYHQFTTGIDRVLSTLHEMQTLSLELSTSTSEEDRRRRRRLQALRWSIALAVTYAGYASVRVWLRRRREWREGSRGTRRAVVGRVVSAGGVEGGGRDYRLGNGPGVGGYNG